MSALSFFCISDWPLDFSLSPFIRSLVIVTIGEDWAPNCTRDCQLQDFFELLIPNFYDYLCHLTCYWIHKTPCYHSPWEIRSRLSVAI